ncbi:MAG: chromosome segregation protein SMC [Thermodesulfovibrionales bacterium]|jgi:chromosome segregation protein
MKIKQIELNGFKSFADRAALPLHEGITCIVGPNGCGKSNVVDAFRWVLGEQSAKSLRGEKMEEVIFQGSATKKQKGMAEVNLIISHSFGADRESNDKGSAEEAREATVARRLYRSGESEYILNRKQCRLKDIRDIFLDTGLDVKSYSILDQGRISEIVNAKPLDRRFLIEEVAGVMKYKVRRAEALAKLETSKQNLQRISDVIAEVKRQLGSLDRQVKKAERYKRLMEELKEADLRASKREHTTLSETLASLTAETDRLREEESSRRSDLSTGENRIEAKRIELVEQEKVLAGMELRLREKEKALSDAEKRIAVLKTTIENRRHELTRLAVQEEELEARKKELLEKISGLRETEEEFLLKVDDLSESMREKKELISGMEASLKEKEEELEDTRREIFRVSERLSNTRNELHKLQAGQENLRYRESVSARDMESVGKGIEAAEGSVADLEEIMMQKEVEISRLQREKEALKAEIESMRTEMEETRAILAREREALASTLARLKSLKELLVDKSLREFLETQRSHGEGHRMLSDSFSTEKGFESAIEAVLAEKTNALVMEGQESILSAVGLIRDMDLGRTSLLYTEAPEPETKGSPAAINHPSIIGKASDYITAGEGSIRSSLLSALSSTYIVKDLPSAFETLHFFEGRQEMTVVTLEGEVLDTAGWVTAGRGREILKRKREIKELQAAAGDLQERISEMDERIGMLSSGLSSQKGLLKEKESAIIDTEKRISLTQQTIRNQKDDLERKKKRLSALEAEAASLSQEREKAEALIAVKTAEVSRLEEEKASVTEEMTFRQSGLAAIRAEYEDSRSRLTELKLTLGSYKEKVDSLRRESRTAEEAIAETERKKERSIEEGIRAEETLRSLAEELKTAEEGIRELILRADSLRQEGRSLKESIRSEGEDLLGQELALKKIRTEIDDLSRRLTAASSQATEKSLRIGNIEETVMQRYGLVIGDEAVEFEGHNPEEDAEKIGELNGRIRDLGPVNLGTIEEYEEQKQRYDFLTRQQQDLTLSISELEEAISRINATTRKKLREAYDLLREKFVGVFTTLFGGGKADIILTDEENILESGLDVIAQPPGKKLQNLNLLSGGEKALTSLALLFAGFLIKPSPLCILDEADAPLDESNTVRYSRMIKELSRDTQFIVITHNRTTMEVADYIYGITMEEPGASRAISLQLEDVAA